MYVTPIGQAQSLPIDFQSSLGDLIEAVGRPNFSEALFRAARSATGCDMLMVFTAACGQAPQTVLMEGVSAPKWRNEKYLNHHWRVDPIRMVEMDRQLSVASLVLMEASELSNAAYRDDCFIRANLASRASVCRIRGERAMRFNLYFSDKRAFDPTVGRYLCDTAEMMDAFLRRHGILKEAQDQRLGSDAIAGRLRIVAPELSGRELQVCTHIARGLTSEGISLELGISLNTVLTYRKRAYARLGISTQNELLQLLIN